MKQIFEKNFKKFFFFIFGKTEKNLHARNVNISTKSFSCKLGGVLTKIIILTEVCSGTLLLGLRISILDTEDCGGSGNSRVSSLISIPSSKTSTSTCNNQKLNLTKNRRPVYQRNISYTYLSILLKVLKFAQKPQPIPD